MVQIRDYVEQKARFMGSHDELAQCSKVILGLPMDSTTSFRPGTRLAPYRVREVSESIEEYSVYLDRSLEELSYYDAGDIIIPYGNIQESLRRIEWVAEQFILQGKQLYCLGGEHLVSLPLIRAYYRSFPELVVFQLDAHADLREDYLGETLSHATVMRHVAELLGDNRVYQMGIRSATKDELHFAARHTKLFLDQLPDPEHLLAAVGDKPVYLTIDIDFLDPAFAPGTGTPEAGGFTSRELLQWLHGMRGLNVVGFDLIEISPPYDQGDNTSILAAKLLREALLSF
jgi:agmatinase